jgi:hypothetical protein
MFPVALDPYTTINFAEQCTNVTLLCDSSNAISAAKNSVLYWRSISVNQEHLLCYGLNFILKLTCHSAY